MFSCVFLHHISCSQTVPGIIRHPCWFAHCQCAPVTSGMMAHYLSCNFQLVHALCRIHQTFNRLRRPEDNIKITNITLVGCKSHLLCIIFWFGGDWWCGVLGLVVFCKIRETNKAAEKTYQVPGSKSGKSKVHSLWVVVLANDGHFGNRTPKRINRAIQRMA